MYRKERGIKLKLTWFSHWKKKSHNIAKTCRYFGISRPTFYYWLNRFKNKGFKGLIELSRRPNNSPGVTDPAVIKKIIALRKRKRQGPKKISIELSQKYGIKLSAKTIFKYLKYAGLNKLNFQKR